MRCLPVNPAALMVELDDLEQTLGLLSSLQAEPIEGVCDIIPGARTLLIRHLPWVLSHRALADELMKRPLARVQSATTRVLEIPVQYQGEDLAEVADWLGTTPADVIRRHTEAEWTVAFTGFAPGFAYLSGGEACLNVPRRASPRTRIPAGAVALAGGFSGIYPKASPGGWQIIGQTPWAMWDLDRNPPALLQPGQRVRFVDMSTGATVSLEALVEPMGSTLQTPVPEPTEPATGKGVSLEVIQPGLQALLQDWGRPGQTGLGVAESGAMDLGSLREANRLVGNPTHTACIEVTLGGFELLSHGDTVLAVTGAEGPLTVTTASGQRWVVPRHQAFALAPGDRLHLASPVAGVRSYVAARGGFDCPPVLGSRSFDTLAQLGPPPLKAGDRLTTQPVSQGHVVGDATLLPPTFPRAGDTVTLDITLGPRTDWFTPEALGLLTQQTWTVTPQSNRVGLRVLGEQPLVRSIHAELPSEGTVRGAIQVPANGQPVLFLADHPLTGGYPVIGCIAPWHLDLAGQIPVGAHIRFHTVADFHPMDTPT